MDNAETRRGQPCIHLRFGEATAILLGLHLLTKSFELAASHDSGCRRAVELLYTAISPNGLIGGQLLDLHGWRDHDEVRNLKTTPLILVAAKLGAHAAGASTEQERVLSHYAERLGLVFQLRDDVLDRETPAESQERAEEIALTTSKDVLAAFEGDSAAGALAELALFAARRTR